MSGKTINITFGTESGNSEMAADDVAAHVASLGYSPNIVPMEELDVSTIHALGKLIVITSTYGEGDLPETAAPFYQALDEQRPELSTLEFAAFGLGDSSYETYGKGIDTISAKLVELGATQVGLTGRHDAAKGEALADVAVRWAKSELSLLLQNSDS